MAFVDSTEADGSATVAAPTGSSGDGIFISASDATATDATLSGFSLVSSGARTWVFYKEHTGSEPANYTVSFSGTVDNPTVYAQTDDDVDPADPCTVSGGFTTNTGTSSTWTGLSVTVPSGGTLVARGITDFDTGVFNSDPSGMTQRETSGGDSVRLWTQAGVSGSSGNRTATLTGSEGWFAIMFATNPRPTGPLVSALDPADNATGVPVSTDLVATFDQSIQVGTGNIRVVEDVPPGGAATVLNRNTDAQQTNATSFTIDCPQRSGPSAPQAGDLSIILVTKDDNEAPTSNWPPTGYSVLFSSATGTTHWIGGLYRICDGSTDPSTVTITESSENWISRGWLIDSHGVTGLSSFGLGTVATGTSAAANPPSVTCPDGTQPHLILYYVGFDGNSSASAHPGGYSNTGTDTTTDATTGNRCGQAYGELASTTAGSDDPGTLTNTNEDWKAITIAIPPEWTRTTVETIDVTDTGQVDITGDTLTIEPTPGTLEGMTQYHIEWDAGIVEATDDSAPVAALSNVTTWNFTTGAAAGSDALFAAGLRQARANSALYNM